MTDSLPGIKALAAVMIWGASFVTTKIVVSQIDPLALVTIRTMGGALVLFGLLRLRGGWGGVVRGRLLGYLALLGFVGVALHLTIQAVGLTLTTASNTSWLVSLSPVFIALLAWLFLGESFGGRRIAGFVVAMSGALLIVVGQAGGFDILRLPGTLGDGLAFASAITWATFSVLSKRAAGLEPPDVLMVHVMTLGGLMTLPTFIARRGWLEFALLDTNGWLALGFIVMFVSSLAYLFWYDALAELDASQAGVFLYLSPLVTAGLAALLLHEPMHPLALAGGGAVLLGVWLVTNG
jgi:drug/metabolite transporter (DMT)-like permease